MALLFLLAPAIATADDNGTQTVNVTETRDYTLAMPEMVSVKNAVGGIDIKWRAVFGAEKYRVFRKLGDGRWCTLLDTTETSCKDKWAKSGNTYTYAVRCIMADGTFTSQMDPTGLSVFYLAAPKLNAPSWSGNAVVVAWDAVDGAENYRVYRKTGNGAWATCTDTTDTTYTDRTVVSGTKYAYTVKCISADGSKVISACDAAGKSIAFTDKPAVKAVSNVIAGVKVTWDTVPGAEKYRVLRKTGDGRWCTLLDTEEASAVDKWAKSGTTYTYTVRCVTADGTLFASDFDSVGKTIRRLAAPKLETVKNDVGGVTMSWNAVPGAEKYRVLRKTGNGNWCKLLDTTDTSCKDKWAKSGTNYTYTVRCVNADGSAFTSSYYEAGKKITYLAAPSCTVKYSPGGVAIEWGAITGAAKYRVYRKTTSGSWAKLADTSNRYYIDKSGKEGTKYSYTVACLDANGKAVSAYNTTGKAIVWKKLSLFVNTDSIEITRGYDRSVTVTFVNDGSVSAKVDDISIATFKWGSWNGDKISLNIIGKKTGTTYITVSNSHDNQTIRIKVEVLPNINIRLECFSRIVDCSYTYALQGADVLDCDLTYTERSDGSYVVYLNYVLKKVFDDYGSASRRFYMEYKLYDASGYVIKSGDIQTGSFGVGETCRGDWFVFYVEPGDYTLHLFGRNDE